MPSPEHAADLERVLTRAAEECESMRGAWFGEGIPQALRAAIEAHRGPESTGATDVVFVEVSSVSPEGRAVIAGSAPVSSCPVVGLSTASLHELASLFGHAGETGVRITRLVCPVGVFDFIAEGIRVREIRHGLTAAALQRHLPIRLWSGPDLKELGTH